VWARHEDRARAWLAGLGQPGQVRGLGPAVAGEKLLLAERMLPIAPPAPEALFPGTGCLSASSSAGRGGCTPIGRHLHAAVAGDAVEVVLVALIARSQGAAKPQAGLDCAGADQVVALKCEVCLARYHSC